MFRSYVEKIYSRVYPIRALLGDFRYGQSLEQQIANIRLTRWLKWTYVEI